MKKPSRVARLINPKAVERARGLDDQMLETYLPSIVITLGTSVDNLLYHKGPIEDVQLTMEALNAVWSEMEARKGTVPLTITADSV